MLERGRTLLDYFMSEGNKVSRSLDFEVVGGQLCVVNGEDEGGVSTSSDVDLSGKEEKNCWNGCWFG